MKKKIETHEVAVSTKFKTAKPSHLPTSHRKREMGFVTTCQICRSRISVAMVEHPKSNVIKAASQKAKPNDQLMKVCTR